MPTISVDYNPMGFTCAPNQATPDYVSYSDFYQFVAYGFVTCWLGTDSGDPNSDCAFQRPVTHEDVNELREHFLDTLETVIGGLWNEDLERGSGYVDGEYQSVIFSTDDSADEMIQWIARLDDESIMLEMVCPDGDSTCIWLDYEALDDRRKVLEVLETANRLVGTKVWPDLLQHILPFKERLLRRMRECEIVNPDDWCDAELDRTADALIAWLNISDPDSRELEAMVAVFTTGRFKWWFCPACKEPVYEGHDAVVAHGEGWGAYQGVCENDMTSYPGRGSSDLRCDACRMRDVGGPHFAAEHWSDD